MAIPLIESMISTIVYSLGFLVVLVPLFVMVFTFFKWKSYQVTYAKVSGNALICGWDRGKIRTRGDVQDFVLKKNKKLSLKIPTNEYLYPTEKGQTKHVYLFITEDNTGLYVKLNEYNDILKLYVKENEETQNLDIVKQEVAKEKVYTLRPFPQSHKTLISIEKEKSRINYNQFNIQPYLPIALWLITLIATIFALMLMYEHITASLNGLYDVIKTAKTTTIVTQNLP